MSWNGHRKISALATLALLLMLALVLLGPMVAADVVDIVTAFAKAEWKWLLPFILSLILLRVNLSNRRHNLEARKARTAAYIHAIGFPFEVYSSADLRVRLAKRCLGHILIYRMSRANRQVANQSKQTAFWTAICYLRVERG